MSVSTVAPVVVKPDIASKNASSGLSICGSPERTYGNAPKRAATSHTSATARKPSRVPIAPCPAVSRSIAQPPSDTTTPVAANGQTGSS